MNIIGEYSAAIPNWGRSAETVNAQISQESGLFNLFIQTTESRTYNTIFIQTGANTWDNFVLDKSFAPNQQISGSSWNISFYSLNPYLRDNTIVIAVYACSTEPINTCTDERWQIIVVSLDLIPSRTPGFTVYSPTNTDLLKSLKGVIPIIEDVDRENPDCSVKRWGFTYIGKNNAIGLLNTNNDVISPNFLCYDDHFYECGWHMNIPTFATKASNKQNVGDFYCDMDIKRWVRKDHFCSAVHFSGSFLGETQVTGWFNVREDHVNNRFLCNNGRFYACGWDLDVPELAINSDSGLRVGNYVCDVNNNRWVYAGCYVQRWNTTYIGREQAVGLYNTRSETIDSRFLCQNSQFYACGWDLDVPEFAKKVYNQQIVGSYSCDYERGMWSENVFWATSASATSADGLDFSASNAAHFVNDKYWCKGEEPARIRLNFGQSDDYQGPILIDEALIFLGARNSKTIEKIEFMNGNQRVLEKDLRTAQIHDVELISDILAMYDIAYGQSDYYDMFKRTGLILLRLDETIPVTHVLIHTLPGSWGCINAVALRNNPEDLNDLSLENNIWPINEFAWSGNTYADSELNDNYLGAFAGAPDGKQWCKGRADGVITADFTKLNDKETEILIDANFLVIQFGQRGEPGAGSVQMFFRDGTSQIINLEERNIIESTRRMFVQIPENKILEKAIITSKPGVLGCIDAIGVRAPSKTTFDIWSSSAWANSALSDQFASHLAAGPPDGEQWCQGETNSRLRVNFLEDRSRFSLPNEVVVQFGDLGTPSLSGIELLTNFNRRVFAHDVSDNREVNPLNNRMSFSVQSIPDLEIGEYIDRAIVHTSDNMMTCIDAVALRVRYLN